MTHAKNNNHGQIIGLYGTYYASTNGRLLKYLLTKQTLVIKINVSENKGNGKYPIFSYVRNISYAKLIMSVKNRECQKTKGIRKHRIITVILLAATDQYLFDIGCVQMNVT